MRKYVGIYSRRAVQMIFFCKLWMWMLTHKRANIYFKHIFALTIYRFTHSLLIYMYCKAKHVPGSSECIWLLKTKLEWKRWINYEVSLLWRWTKCWSSEGDSPRFFNPPRYEIKHYSPCSIQYFTTRGFQTLASGV